MKEWMLTRGRNTRGAHLLIVAGVIIAVLCVLYGPRLAQSVSITSAGLSCERTETSDPARVDCWLDVVLSYVRDGNIATAYKAFGSLYDAYPMFGATGCHQHAHKVGDTAYYELFLARGMDIQDMDFPQETVSCGYGFFHGFIEHLIQDHPDPAYVTEVCEHLRGQYASTMRDIGTICYHASGHGFMIAEADVMQQGKPLSFRALVERPLLACEGFPRASAREQEDCREGVFNVISDWMALNDFGLSFDYEDPFGRCDALPKKWHRSCYYELGMKLYPITGDSPLAAATFVHSIQDPELQDVTYGVMVAGMMQRQAPLGGEEAMLSECTEVKDDVLRDVCVRSVANGIMEHGSPGKEYEKVLPLCAALLADNRAEAAICYASLTGRLARFYPPEKRSSICAQMPAPYDLSCQLGT